MRLSIPVLAAAAALVLAAPAPAAPVPSSTVQIANGSLIYKGSPAGNSVDVVTSLGGVLVVRDSGPLRPTGDGCLRLSATEAFCQVVGVERIVAALDGGDDRFRSTAPLPVVVTGGVGDDVISGTAGRDVLFGDAGRDVLRAGGGDDVVFARDGVRDRVSCGAGADRVDNDFRSETSGCEQSRR